VKDNGLAVITGASSGIGAELSTIFAKHGYPLLLVARSADKLKAFAAELSKMYGVFATPLALDLASPEAPMQVLETAANTGRTVDVLVNNAGYGTYGPFVETDLATTLQLLQVNMVALTHLTRLFLPEMVRRNQGGVLNVASTAAFQPGPLMAVYYASKAYVLHFSEAIAEELQSSNITVTALCPGPTSTGFESRAGMQQTKLFQSGRVMNARDVAEAGYRGLLRGRRCVVPGFWNKVFMQAVRISPRRLVVKIAKRMQERR